jgi:hypothetical protein
MISVVHTQLLYLPRCASHPTYLFSPYGRAWLHLPVYPTGIIAFVNISVEDSGAFFALFESMIWQSLVSKPLYNWLKSLVNSYLLRAFVGHLPPGVQFFEQM